MEKIKIENIDIPIKSDNINLKGSIYYSSNTSAKAPWILVLPGLSKHRNSYFAKFYSENFAKAGYYVLSYDYRAHGETAKQTGKNWLKKMLQIYSDCNEVISWIFEEQSNRLLDDKIALFGRSIGGAIILTRGFIDERAKALIALCTRYDYSTTAIKFPEETIKKISPKYFIKEAPSNNKRIFIAHCKDDPQIPFENFNIIKKSLGLKDENAVEYESGGHSFKDHQEDLLKKSIEFLKKI